MDIRTLLDAVTKHDVPFSILFDGSGVEVSGRLLGVRRFGNTEALALEVSDEAPPQARILRVRVPVERVLYEFAVPILDRSAGPRPVLLTRLPFEIHAVERRSHVRVTPSPGTRLLVAIMPRDPVVPARILNLSQGGVAFHAPEVGRLSPGQSVARLELSLDAGPAIVTSGVVRNVFSIRYPTDTSPIYGVQWERLSPDEVARLIRYTNARKAAG